MENASKALIIAGAILIAIVLITVGVAIIGKGQDAANQANIDDQVVSTWNQKFIQYAGEKVSGSNVNVLMNQIISSNGVANKDGEVAKVIAIVAGGTGTNDVTVGGNYKCYKKGTTTEQTKGTAAITKSAKAGVYYSVTMAYNAEGYVCEVTIKANT